MAVLRKKIKAATLVETIVALTIILTAFSIALIVFVNILKTERSWDHLNAVLLLKQVSVDTKLKKIYFDEWLPVKQYDIVKKIIKYEENPHLMLLEIKIYTKNGNLLEQSKELIINY